MSKHILRLAFNPADPFDAAVWSKLETEGNRRGFVKKHLYDCLCAVKAAPPAGAKSPAAAMAGSGIVETSRPPKGGGTADALAKLENSL